MWLSQQIARETAWQEDLHRGVVTVGGENPAVFTQVEDRDLSILSPGGYHWRPQVQDKVLVSRASGGCVLGKVQPACCLDPGEIRIMTGAASISLLPSGEIRLTGDVYINGEKWKGASQ